MNDEGLKEKRANLIVGELEVGDPVEAVVGVLDEGLGEVGPRLLLRPVLLLHPKAELVPSASQTASDNCSNVTVSHVTDYILVHLVSEKSFSHLTTR